MEEGLGHHLATFSLDGKKLAAAGGVYSSKISIWTLPAKKKLEFKHEVAGWNVKAISLSPDGKLLAVGGEGYLKIYDADSGELRYSISGPEEGNTCFDALAFSPDGKFFAYAGGTNWASKPGEVGIRLCDPETGKVIRPLQGCKQKVWTLAFSSDGKKLAAAGRDEPIHLWNVDDGKVIQEIPFTKADKLAFSPDGAKVAFGGMSMNEIHIWDVAAGKDLLTVDGGPAYSLTFSPDGKRLAVANLSCAIGLWDANTGEEVPQFAGHNRPVFSVAFSPDGKLLAGDGSILWHLPSGKLQRLGRPCGYAEGQRPGTGDSKCTTAFSSDGKQLIGVGGWDTGPTETAFSVRNTVSGERLFGIQAGRGHSWNSWTSSVALAPDDDTVATADIFGVHLWSLASRKMAREFVLRPPENQTHHLPTDNERCAVFSPDGRTLAAADAVDHVIRLWDWKSGTRLREFPVDAKFCMCLAFSPDGALLAGCNPGPACVWETATGKLLCKFGETREGTRSVAFAPDGRRLVVATKKSVDVWDMLTGDELSARDGKPLLAGGHLGDVLCAAISPDGKTIASGSADTTILLWDAHDLLPKTPTTDPGPKGLDALWADLCSDDAPTAYKAVLALLGAPDKAAALVKERLRPAVKPDPKKVKDLLAALNSNDLDERDAAAKGLAELGEAVEPALRETLAGKPSAEVQARCERLLEAIQKGELGPEERRGLRAVQVLEQVGTPEAHAALKDLADGAPGRLSRAAKLALDLLDRHTP